MQAAPPQPATSDFPNGFLWGAATAAFQIEGAATADGKGPSIWDVFCATPGKTARGETGNVACDHYGRWREDVGLMCRLNLRAYRFSVSWPRVLPQGRGAVNQAGLDFYDRLVDKLRSSGIEPFVTLYHWDLPAALQMELGGWAHPDLPQIFADYARVVFERLGDRVGYWITINEPWVVTVGGHLDGVHAPGVRDRARAYQVAHQLLRGHGLAVEVYRGRGPRAGQISLALNMPYYFPATDSDADRAAAERAMVDYGGWFGDPVSCGAYPELLRRAYPDVLPEFTDEDRRRLRGSVDYVAINYYSSMIARHKPGAGPLDVETEPYPGRPRTMMDWPIVPEGLEALLCWLSERYKGLPVYVTENGAACDDRPDASEYVDDQDRIAYLRDHFAAAQRARARGVDLRGFFVWSLMDNLEWAEGFSKRFGLVRCNFETLRRTVKASGEWYGRWIAAGGREPEPLRAQSGGVGERAGASHA